MDEDHNGDEDREEELWYSRSDGGAKAALRVGIEPDVYKRQL